MHTLQLLACLAAVLLVGQAFEDPDDGLLKQIKELSDEVMKNATCPDLKMGWKCGNGVCEPKHHETPQSCPMDCNDGWTPYSHQVICYPTLVAFPASIDEVVHYVHEAARTNNTLRACGAGHSTNSACCTDGILLVMTKLNKPIGITTNGDTILATFEAGTTMTDVYSYLDSNGLAIGYAVPGYRHMTLAGAISTGTHGSSPKHSSVVSSLVEALDVVTPWGEVRTYSADSADADTWRAHRAAYGMLGVIVRVTIRVQRQFQLSFSWNGELKNKDLYNAKEPVDLMAGCDYGVLHWWPNQDSLVRVCGMNTTDEPDETIRNNFICVPGQSMMSYPLAAIMQIASCYNPIKKLMEKVRHDQFTLMPYLTRKNFMGLPTPVKSGVGPSWEVMSDEGCKPEPWDHAVLTIEYELAIPMDTATEAFKFIETFLKENDLFMPMFGFFLRFGPSQETTLIAHSVGRPVVFMDFVEYHVKGPHADQYPAYNAPMLNKLVALLISKFGARIHWGKNFDFMFSKPYGINSFGDNWTKFLNVRKAADPHCLFRSTYTQDVGLAECDSTDTHAYAPPCAACAPHQNEYAPVCGKNKRTYLHACSASCDGLHALDILPGTCEDYLFYEKYHEGVNFRYAFAGQRFVKAWQQ